MKKLAIASDHAGVDTKNFIKKELENRGYTLKDFGTFSTESVDYPDFAHPMAEALEDGLFDFGISLCGSGNGINMTANKHQQIRSALCWKTKIAELARKHNDANICALPARFVTKQEALQIAEVFLSAEFEGGRHQRRIKKIPLG